jgi:hypothetical protein
MSAPSALERDPSETDPVDRLGVVDRTPLPLAVGEALALGAVAVGAVAVEVGVEGVAPGPNGLRDVFRRPGPRDRGQGGFERVERVIGACGSP